MRSYIAAGAVIAASLSGAAAEPGAQEINGNWYANLVQKITYTGLGGSGQYQRVTNMDNGQCAMEAHDYSGNLAPLDEEVSLHFRGPLDLKQVAIYYPSSSSSKAKARRSAHERRHGHADFHKRNKEIREIQEQAEAEKRAVGDMVTATINGQVVSWVNQWDGAGAATPAAAATPAHAPAAAHAAPAAAHSAPVKAAGAAGFIGNAISVVQSVAGVATSAAAAPTKSSSSSSSGSGSSSAAHGDWTRTGYYDADSQTADGVAFLNNFGGQGSGVFDNTWGNSLSYAAASGQSGAASPETLNATLPSNVEVILFSDKECKSGSGCGYSRPGSVAQHGFGGNTKAFFFEFSMPDDGQTGFNGNMPSVWLLNAQIPRTGQYSSCSCWQSGCGEFDICEVLDSGNSRCKSTYHGNTPGGSSDYFQRPTTGTIKLAVVLIDDQIHVQQLDDSQQFGSTLPKSTIDSISSDSSSSDLISSIFALVS